MENNFSKVGEDVKKQYWLEPTAAALAKLDEIQSSVDRMKPASSFNVQSVWHPLSSTPVTTPNNGPPENALPENAPFERSASRIKSSPYTELDVEPPMSTVNIQKTATAWGSNTSIPDLIKAQGERQKQKGAPRRPWSGRKVPPSPTLQRRGTASHAGSGGDTIKGASGAFIAGSGRKVPPSPTLQRRGTASHAGSGGDTIKGASGAFIAVSGAKSVMYDASSRPPSGRPQVSSSSSSTTVPPTSPCDVFEMMEAANAAPRPTAEGMILQGEDNALEEFLKSQPNGHKHELSKLSAAYADKRNITPPPPPPCASPDLEKLINGGSQGDEEVDSYYGDVNHTEAFEEKKEPSLVEQFIRQPSHVPPQLLRRPTPEPIRLSMTIPAAEGEEEDSIEEDRSSGAPSPRLSPDIDVQSVTSEVTAQFITSQQSSPVHSTIATPHGLDSTIGQSRVDDGDDDERDVSDGKPRKGRQSVKFVEERNVTFDITPRDKTSSHRPSPPSNSRIQRPHSALKSSSSRKSIVQKKRPLSANVRGSRSLTQERDGSTENSDDGQEVTNDEIMDAINNNGMSQLLDHLSRQRNKKDIKTMMSKLDISDEGNQDTSEALSRATPEVPQGNFVRTVQVSSTTSKKQNYYEKAIQAKKKNMYHQQNTANRTLTTKVIEFGDDGPSMETKEVSYFQVAAAPSQVKPVRPMSSRGPRRGWEDSNLEGSHVNRPSMEKKSFVEQQIARPTSRLGSYADLETPNPLETDKGDSPHPTAIQRARPRSAILKAKPGVTPHQCGRPKSPSGNKQRPHSSFVNSNSPKKPVRRSSSPSGLPHSNSNRALVPTVVKSKAEMQRNREAVRALKDGSLKKTKTYGKQIAAVDSRPPVGRSISVKNKQGDEKGSDSDSIDEYPKSMREEEVFNLHRHLTRSGVKVTYKALKRGLVAPDEKNLSQCLDQLPSNVSLNLLSKPEAWLGETYQNYRIAENALRRAETQLAIQEEKARIDAQKRIDSLKSASGKKKKKTKGTKKRPKSPASSRSCLSSAKSGASILSTRSKVIDGDRAVSALSALGLDPDEVFKEDV